MDKQADRVKRVIQLFIDRLDDEPEMRNRSNCMKADHLSAGIDLEYDSPHSYNPQGQESTKDPEENAVTELLQIAERWGVKEALPQRTASVPSPYRSDGITTQTSLSAEQKAICAMLAKVIAKAGDEFDQNQDISKELCRIALQETPNYVNVKSIFDLILPNAESKERIVALSSVAKACGRFLDCTVQYVIDVIGVSSILPDTVLY